jgi:hypothetical protein
MAHPTRKRMPVMETVIAAMVTTACVAMVVYVTVGLPGVGVPRNLR